MTTVSLLTIFGSRLLLVGLSAVPESSAAYRPNFEDGREWTHVPLFLQVLPRTVQRLTRFTWLGSASSPYCSRLVSYPNVFLGALCFTQVAVGQGQSQEKRVFVCSLKSIEAGQELCISYPAPGTIGLGPAVNNRGFKCNCEACRATSL